MKRFLPYISGVLMAVIFGFSFLFSKNAIENIGVFELLFARFFVAFLFMTSLLLLRVIKVDFKGKNLKPILIVVAWQPVIYFISESSGLKYTTSSIAGVMIACIPVVSSILGIFILNERPSKMQIICIMISITGVFSLLLLGGSMNTSGQLKGILFLLCAVISAAMYNIFSRKASKSFSPMEITYVMMCTGMIVFGLIFVGDELMNAHFKNVMNMNINTLVAIGYLGILSSVIAFLLVNFTLSKLPAAQASVFANLTTVVSILAGVVFRNEAFGIYQLISAFVIVFGVFGTNYFRSVKSQVIEERLIL